jgi:hypothetical protein
VPHLHSGQVLVLIDEMHAIEAGTTIARRVWTYCRSFLGLVVDEGARPSSRTRDRLQPARRCRVPGERNGLQMGCFSGARGSSGRHDCLFIVC